MAPVPAFYTVNEEMKLIVNRIHHNNSLCVAGRDIRVHERRPGTGNYRLCLDCRNLNDQGR